jgi:hypothetical protein
VARIPGEDNPVMSPTLDALPRAEEFTIRPGERAALRERWRANRNRPSRIDPYLAVLLTASDENDPGIQPELLERRLGIPAGQILLYQRQYRTMGLAGLDLCDTS